MAIKIPVTSAAATPATVPDHFRLSDILQVLGSMQGNGIVPFPGSSTVDNTVQLIKDVNGEVLPGTGLQVLIRTYAALVGGVIITPSHGARINFSTKTPFAVDMTKFSAPDVNGFSTSWIVLVPTQELDDLGEDHPQHLLGQIVQRSTPPAATEVAVPLAVLILNPDNPSGTTSFVPLSADNFTGTNGLVLPANTGAIVDRRQYLRMPGRDVMEAFGRGFLAHGVVANFGFTVHPDPAMNADFTKIEDAVDAVPDGSIIYVFPASTGDPLEENTFTDYILSRPINVTGKSIALVGVSGSAKYRYGGTGAPLIFGFNGLGSITANDAVFTVDGADDNHAGFLYLRNLDLYAVGGIPLIRTLRSSLVDIANCRLNGRKDKPILDLQNNDGGTNQTGGEVRLSDCFLFTKSGAGANMIEHAGGLCSLYIKHCLAESLWKDKNFINVGSTFSSLASLGTTFGIILANSNIRFHPGSTLSKVVDSASAITVTAMATSVDPTNSPLVAPWGSNVTVKGSQI